MMDKPLKDIHREVFEEGQKAVARELVAELFEEESKLAKKTLETASDVIDLADQIAADGNPHKRRLAEIVKDGVVQSLSSMRQVTSGKLPAREGEGAAQAIPFLSDSSSSSTPLTATPPKALENHSPEKRKRGRPSKPR